MSRSEEGEEKSSCWAASRIEQDSLLGSIEAVELISGGFGCSRGGELKARPLGGFGTGFLARFDVAEPGNKLSLPPPPPPPSPL